MYLFTSFFLRLFSFSFGLTYLTLFFSLNSSFLSLCHPIHPSIYPTRRSFFSTSLISQSPLLQPLQQQQTNLLFPSLWNPLSKTKSTYTNLTTWELNSLSKNHSVMLLHFKKYFYLLPTIHLSCVTKVVITHKNDIVMLDGRKQK